MKNIPAWGWWCIALTVLAIFFLTVMRGYSYISYTLLFIACLIAVFSIGPLWLKRIVAVVTAVGLVYFFAVEALIIRAAAGDRNPGRSYVIVLGAAVHGDEPSLALLHRMQTAFSYLSTYPESKAVVSGGQGKGENMSEAQCMHDWLIAQGIAEERIIMENRSTSTMENLEFSKQLILADGGSLDDIAIESSGYHLYRAESMAKKIGINATGVKAVRGYPVYTLGMYIREAFGVTHMWVLGY